MNKAWQDLFTGRLVNILTALVSAILLLFNVSKVDSNKDTIDLSDYKVTFADYFSEDELNGDNWHVQNSEGLRKGGYWDMGQCSVNNGYLTITTEYKEDGKFGAGWYTCGISSRDNFEQKYGYFEINCKLPKGQGLWSAFWLTCPNASKVMGSGKYGAEIDIFESPYGFKSGKDSWKVSSNIHYNGYDLETKYKNVIISALDNDPYENFNKYGVLWTEDEYIFYVNDVEVARTSFGGVSQEEEYMVISCEVDGAAATPTYGWSGIITRNSEGNNFKSEFVIDYVKVYAEK